MKSIGEDAGLEPLMGCLSGAETQRDESSRD